MAEIPKSYAIADLDPDGLGLSGSGLNDHGHICGSGGHDAEDSFPFLFRDGELIRLPDEGDNQTRPYDLNNPGLLVGRAERSGKMYPCAWRDERFEWLEEPGTGDTGWAHSANDRGEILGTTGDTNRLRGRFGAALWRDGGRNDLDVTLFGADLDSVRVSRISESGVITGWCRNYGFLWRGDTIERVPYRKNENPVQLNAINAHGTVVGNLCPGGYQRMFACVYRDGKTTRILPSKTSESCVADLNDGGLIVGTYYATKNSTEQPFVAIAAGFVELNKRLSGPSDFVIERPVAINNPGQILALAKRGDEDTLVLLTPTG